MYYNHVSSLSQHLCRIVNIIIIVIMAKDLCKLAQEENPPKISGKLHNICASGRIFTVYNASKMRFRSARQLTALLQTA